MPVSVTMPRLGESVTEGTVTRWLKQEGDRVEVDEPLLEVSTDKVDTEIPSPAAGILQKILVAEDETAEVGADLAIINGDSGSESSSAPATSAEPVARPKAEPEAEPQPKPQPEPQAQPQAQPEAEAAPEQAPAATEPPPERPTADTAPAGDATAVKMPALGESVTEGTVTRWLKSVGDTVEVDEPLLEVSTDKVDTEIPSPVAGTLVEITVSEDETVEVGAQLALIGAAGAAPAQPAPAAPPASAPTSVPEPTKPAQPAPQPVTTPPTAPPPVTPPPVAPQAVTPPAATPEPVAAEAAEGYVTPLVRKLANQHGVDLATVKGTGVGGRIRKQDVLDAAAAAEALKKLPGKPEPAVTAPSPLRGRTEKLPRLRMLIARRMIESLQISAQLTTVVEVDVTRIARLREQAKRDFLNTHGVKLSYLPFFALATVEALRQHPNVNASMDMEAGTVTYHDGEHLSMAVDTEKGLIVPVIHNAGDLNLAGLAKRIADIAERTRNNKITPDELSGGTFTITNTGSRGALFDTPIINQPQSAILGTGAVVKRAVVVEDPALGELIVPRSMVYLALSYDHRLVDGADAARFLTSIKERLEAGQFESELGL